MDGLDRQTESTNSVGLDQGLSLFIHFSLTSTIKTPHSTKSCLSHDADYVSAYIKGKLIIY